MIRLTCGSGPIPWLDRLHMGPGGIALVARKCKMESRWCQVWVGGKILLYLHRMSCMEYVSQRGKISIADRWWAKWFRLMHDGYLVVHTYANSCLA